jgi:hypothetical protein
MKRFALTFVFLIGFIANFPARAASSDLCPIPAPYFVRTRALNGNNFSIYIPGKQFAYMGFPATAFGYQVMNVDSWTENVELLPFNGSWYDLMSQYNTKGGENYVQNSDNGTFFGTTKGIADKLGVLTYPGNVMRVIARKYRRGECQDLVAAKPWLSNAPPYSETLTWDPWYWQYETTEQNATAPQINPAPKNNGNIRVPLVAKKDIVTGQYGIWFPDSWLESFPSMPVTIHAQYNVYIRESGYGTPPADPNNPLAFVGDSLVLDDYYPIFNRTYGHVTDTRTGVIGWISLAYYPRPSYVLYTTDWQMQTPPVPPG